MSSVDALYLDAELFVLTARQAVYPRSRVAPMGQPFPGFGLAPQDEDQPDHREGRES